MNDYYDEVVALIRGVESILVFGPGEAKNELHKRLERGNLGGRVVAVQLSDRMTDREIAAKVREHVREVGRARSPDSS